MKKRLHEMSADEIKSSILELLIITAQCDALDRRLEDAAGFNFAWRQNVKMASKRLSVLLKKQIDYMLRDKEESVETLYVIIKDMEIKYKRIHDNSLKLLLTTKPKEDAKNQGKKKEPPE